MIIRDIEDYYLDRNQMFLAKLYKAIVARGYYGLLRVGELPTGAHPILSCNIHIAKNKPKIQIILPSSKTHSVANIPQKITIIRTTDNELSGYAINQYCPYSILKQHLEARGNYDTDDKAFFVFRDETQVKPYHLRNILRQS